MSARACALIVAAASVALTGELRLLGGI